MNSNRRRATNAIHGGRLLKWIVLVMLICLWGLCLVGIKNRIHAMSMDRIGLEKQLKNLQEESSVLHTQVAQWSSHKQLQKRLDEGFIQLQPIPDERIVRLRMKSERPGMEGLRAVSNKVRMR